MATPTARGTGRPGAHDGQQNQIPDGPLTLDETRRVAELHRRDLASRRIQAEQADDFDTTDEYDDDPAEAEDDLSDEDEPNWNSGELPGENHEMVGGDIDVDIHDEEPNPDEYDFDEMEDTTPVFDPAAIGLKEINNLAHFSVSSHKPGNGVAELLGDDLDKYWQSDGQQPHLLTMHFLRRVEIRAIRFYVDYLQDESYTPTHILWYAGTGHHDLMQFGEQGLVDPRGWQEIKIEGCGGGHDGNSLCCFIVQMHVKENHQNGKDTHIRGIKIYALDDNTPRASGSGGVDSVTAERSPRRTASGLVPSQQGLSGELLEDAAADESNPRPPQTKKSRPAQSSSIVDLEGMTVPDFLREPELR
ncbi:hypothetical protein MCOR27_004477 [Pyricularia oryzae]|uniref:DOC domain-containing protein n=3 Tax=Pyricularia TaxID=48558 RepID=A0ABQ8NIR8_PYRGI|nr:hypothetical protein MCOR01_001010 [Pyricularia oryzae]KAI6297295.1 hypothetical protein MCOR33_006348 [Pyricularia grisea]KAH9430475.1 hypothetical protein MCOR02_010175 [Pyricularia oryzae]KAI6257956.1 hypothetical protein MCOR19_005623 [Pyricularia oryzae]KAI6273852.1 hypothetical protein MCOR26_006718 [Pyricularia oryzae]